MFLTFILFWCFIIVFPLHTHVAHKLLFFWLNYLQLRPYHLNPPGVLHPFTVFYELSFGETELKQGMLFTCLDWKITEWGVYCVVHGGLQGGIHLFKFFAFATIPDVNEWYWFINSFLLSAVEVRRSLHSRLGLPYDRPLLRIANALDFSRSKSSGSESLQKGNNHV